LNGQQFATASDDNTIKIWNDSTFKCERVLSGNRVNDCAFSPNGLFLISVSYSGAKIWKVATGECIKMLSAPSPMVCCAFAPNGNCFVVGSDSLPITVYDSKTFERIATLAYSVTNMCISLIDTELGK
jgi:WD40 repeat protein